MMDFVLAVDDPVDWHKENIQRNPTHYSTIKYAGPEYITRIQDSFGAKVYYNTLIPTHAGLIKYGVVSKENLVTDLLDWETLYLSGRLHKPVNVFHKSENNELKAALKINLFAALHTALLLLPEEFTEQQLYHTIAGISYSGDFRMYFGEDPNKVRNIVEAQLSEFRKVYFSVFQDLRDYLLLDFSRGCGEQDVSHSAKYFHLSMLPKMLQSEIVSEWNKDGRSRDLEDVLRAAAIDPDSCDIVLKGIKKIVRKSSLSQSLKGILTAGPVKTIKYSSEKVKKLWSALRR